jgi:dienelactone hydrolase
MGAMGAMGSAAKNEDPASTGTFPPVTDFMAHGPFEAVTVDGTGPNNNYTVYHPKDLAPSGAKNPIVGWMSGGGTNPALYPLLPLLATHGFVVVASNTVPGIGEEANLGKEIIAGIDWAIAENAREGSTFFQKLDTTMLASMGYSMGSLATFQIAADPRLVTTVHISGGNMAPEPINNLHAPAAFLCGIPGDDTCNILDTTCDIAAANCDKDFAAAKAPVFYANFEGGHLGILTPPLQEQIQAEAVAWLRWQLMGDNTIRARFVGDQCGVCQDTRWKTQQKNWQ